MDGLDTALDIELAQVCGGLNQLHARLVRLVAGALTAEEWAGDGVRSPEHWLVLRAGLSPSRAREVVALARREAELPTLMDTFAGGHLSLDQVSTVARHAPAPMEASVTELAVNATVPRLRRTLSRYAFPDEPASTADPSVDAPATNDGAEDAGPPMAPTPERRVEEPADLAMGCDADGRFTLRFSAPPDLGALVEAALMEARDALFHAGRPEVTWATALAEVCERSLANPPSPGRRDAFRVLVHLDTDGAWLNARPALPRHLLHKLTCEGSLRPLWVTEGHPVNVGRALRIVPDRTRRLVEDRDRGCRFPGCAATAVVKVHHVIHWADGGPTDTPNLVSLCPHHHDRHHAVDYDIRGDADLPDGLTFTNRWGHLIRPAPAYRPPIPSHSPDPSSRPDSVGSAGQGSPPDSPGSPDQGSPPDPGSSADPGGHGAVPGHTGGPTAPPYDGPTGEILHSRWVTFTESAPIPA
ncbi:HNH endonuclease signature motif containing protein [Oryzihumus leptocrescens]|uniref:HNH endonuclease n=1 Tax=Oryzihumus leptocrescens TaxID=297536 RepID=A0A542ZKH0_9MICO|nr:HNH endonuclease signature motif containing protein [Oryzihumus leptocrescens]TQL60788.1 HNH endonuclease [Oryzihumus leptocrescens]